MEKTFAQRVILAFQDMWDVSVALGGAGATAYELVSKIDTVSSLQSNASLWFDLFFFVLFGSIAIIKAKQKQRKFQKELLEKNEEFKNNLSVKNKELENLKSQLALINSSTSLNASNGGLSVLQNNNSPINIITGESKKKEIPNIVAGFLNEEGKICLKATIQLRPPSPRPNINELVDEKRTELLMKGEKEKDLYTKAPRGNGSSSIILQEIVGSIENYPRRVEKFLEEYAIYQKSLYASNNFQDRYRRLSFAIVNKSDSPAHKVTVKLFVPDDFPFPPKYVEEIATMNSLYRNQVEKYEPLEPKEPQIIELPRTNTFSDFHHDYSAGGEKVWIGGLKISSKNGKNIVQYDLDTLIQNLTDENFPPFFMWLGNIERSRKITIPIEIYAEELPQEKKCNFELKVVIQE